MNLVLRDVPMYHSLQNACLIEDKEIGVINENYQRSMADETNDDDMECEGQGTGGGRSTTQEPTTGDAEASAEGAGRSTAPDMHDASRSPSTLKKSSRSPKTREQSSRPSTRSLPWPTTTTSA